jgi:CBS domain-containing protein
MIAVRPTHTIGHAERLMRMHRITRVVVLDEAGRALGILSLSDVVQYVRPSRAGLTLQRIAERKYGPQRP